MLSRDRGVGEQQRALAALADDVAAGREIEVEPRVGAADDDEAQRFRRRRRDRIHLLRRALVVAHFQFPQGAHRDGA